MNRLHGVSRRLFETPVSPIPLGVFRIGFASILLLEALQLFFFRRLVWDPIPFAERSRFPTAPLLGAWVVALLFVLVGYRTRAAAWIQYVCAVCVLGFSVRHLGFEYHADSINLTLSFLLLFLPSGAALSVDARLRGRRQSVLPLYRVFLALTVGLMYFDSVLWKVSSEMWRSGLGWWTPTTLPSSVYFDISLFTGSELLCRIIGYFVLIYETAFVLLVWFRRPRAVLALVGIAFHLAIGTLFPLPAFGLGMIPIFLGLLPASWYERLGGPFRTEADVSLGATPGELRLSAAGRIAVAGLLAAWFAAFALTTFAGPLYRTHLPSASRWTEPLGRAADRVWPRLYPFTGLSTHGLFVDDHFERYTTQTALVARNGSTEEYLPIVAANGTARLYAVGRLNIKWLFGTVRPSMTRDEVGRELARFAAFWAGARGIDLADRPLTIRQRPNRASVSSWVPDLLRENLAAPWRDVGRIEGPIRDLRVSWFPEEALRK